MNKKVAFSFILAFVVFGLPDAALAKNNKAHGHGAAKTAEHGVIGSSNREAIKTYLKETYGKKCPPGLAKKNNGCLPPGIAKKYAVGQVLPEGVVAGTLPAALLKELYPAARGQKYIQVDKDILLIDQATRKVLDAITLFSAVGG